jgi:hypothetical protein
MYCFEDIISKPRAFSGASALSEARGGSAAQHFKLHHHRMLNGLPAAHRLRIMQPL